jgi:phosphoribosylformimino-5-aminoimidazole carboxamide ribotide isomerase
VDVHSDSADLPFEVIPVIDLMGGQVVHARRGDRTHYLPLSSVLCKSARPADVAEGLLSLFPFRRLYVADLEALAGRGRQRHALDSIARAVGNVQLWIDAGLRCRADLAEVQRGGTAVLASESLTEAAAWNLIETVGHDAILSLDFRDGDFLGPPGLLRHPERWPRRLIAMNLARVGSDLGPDVARIETLYRLAPAARVYAAGGIRRAEDMAPCRCAGAAGVLVATSLHDGSITAADLAAMA